MLLFHLTAHAGHRSALLTEHAIASSFWARLQQAFPLVLAAVLMTDHVHLAAAAESARVAKRQLAQAIGGLRRSHIGSSTRWQPVPDPAPIVDAAKAARHVRYIVLNPCRAGLVQDPLAWIWSTHRDVVGAIARPWVRAMPLARALGKSQRGFPAWIHRYVSSTPEVAVVGTPLPTPTIGFGLHGVARIVAAAAAAMRSSTTAVARPGPTRALFIHLARANGWTDTALLARICAMTPRGVRYELAREPPDLTAAALCLGDDRLCGPYLADASAWVTIAIARSSAGSDDVSPGAQSLRRGRPFVTCSPAGTCSQRT